MRLRRPIAGPATQDRRKVDKFYLILILVGATALVLGCLLGLQRLIG